MPSIYRNYLFSLPLLALFGVLSCHNKEKLALNQAESTNTLLDSLTSEAANDPDFLIGGDPLISKHEVRRFYESRNYLQAWTRNEELSHQAYQLIESVSQSRLEGLYPNDYHYETILSLLAKGRPYGPGIERLVKLDILLTDAYLLYAKHLYNGKVCPEDLNQQWHVTCREFNFNLWEYLSNAIQNDLIENSLEQLKPPYQGYYELKKALVRYRELQDLVSSDHLFYGLPYIDNLNLQQIEARLMVLGDLSDAHRTNPDSLADAMKRFQLRHGLDPHGGIDSITIRVLNTNIDDYIGTIQANLERWRWLPENLGDRHIIVNIANFSLQLFKNNQEVFKSSVIAGTPYHSTPAFSADLTHLIVNPYWWIPHSISVNEILARNHPINYLKLNNIEVLNSKNQSIPLDSIDFSEIGDHNFPYKLRQQPGPGNALGRIKFEFSNPFSVYIHDTPNKSLFEENERTFSHGCIRLQNPFELAAILLEDQPKWDLTALNSAVSESTEPIRIDLLNTVPVHILYWTAWMDQNQLVQIRKDIYGRDIALIKALEAPVN